MGKEVDKAPNVPTDDDLSEYDRSCLVCMIPISDGSLTVRWQSFCCGLAFSFHSLTSASANLARSYDEATAHVRSEVRSVCRRDMAWKEHDYHSECL
jgi:hypothetical protein